ncbi:MAG: O-antigen ligase family protein [Actinomycetia bacterium]|nr:O-antigen ligase family protein [Actinomycetes bacterium]
MLAATGGIYVWMSLLTQVWGLPGQRIYAGGLTSSRLVGMSVHPNTLAPIAAVTILLLISNGTRRASAHLTIAAAALVLVLTESRVMLVALVVARVVLAIGSRRALIVLITLFSSLAVSVAVEDSTAGVLESISRDPESADAVTLSGRIKVWDDGLKRRSESTLLGAGWASSPAQYATDGVAGTSLNPAHPHNGWIAVYQELGLIGLAASVAIVIGLIGRSTDPRRRALLAFVLIANLGESLMWSAQRSLVDFVFMGIIASMSATSGRHWPETTFKPSERMITL